MKLIITLVIIGLIISALYQKWRSIPPQTKQMWLMVFGAAKMAREAKKQMREQGGYSPQNPTTGSVNGGASPFEFPYGTTTQQTEPRDRVVYKMQACTKCGLHVPENEGVVVRGQFYCCVEHAQ